MHRSWRGFWIGSTVFLLGLSVLPLAASGLFKSSQESTQPRREDRPAFRGCKQRLTSPEGKYVSSGLKTPTASYDCDGGPGGCAL